MTFFDQTTNDEGLKIILGFLMSANSWFIVIISISRLTISTSDIQKWKKQGYKNHPSYPRQATVY